MRTLHLGLRVTDLDRSLAFYPAIGYETGTGVSHLVVQVESMADTLAALAARRIELVQWPAHHADGMTIVDFLEKEIGK